MNQQTIMRMLGVNDKQLQDALCKLEKLRCNMQALAWSQMLEFGQVTNAGVQPHMFDDTPYCKSENANGLVKHDFLQLLGKPSTRGHIKNRGDAELTITAYTMQNQYTNPYVLAGGDVFDFGSFAIKELSITAPAGEAVPYTLFAQ